MRHNPPRGGPLEPGGWRSPAKVAENWQACRRMLRVYRIALLLLLLAFGGWVTHALGYWQGYEDGRAAEARHDSQR